MPEHAKALAYYDHPFFGKWPAITENEFGAGTLLYEGTYLSDTLQTTIAAHRSMGEHESFARRTRGSCTEGNDFRRESCAAAWRRHANG
jgi:hypothetical protein